MALNDELKAPVEKKIEKKIVIRKNGPYVVSCGIPLAHKSQVVSEHGEPLTWKKEAAAECTAEYALCRCGGSANKPFCDGTHHHNDFDGSETADTGLHEASHVPYPAGYKIIVEKDSSLCMSSGFCGFADAKMPQLVLRSDNSQIRALVMAMVERCPSGAMRYRLEANGPLIEPDLPQQIAATTEITSAGPITGPLWATGGISIERSDGQPFETRNRVTLCNCGQSSHKPLCDGTHRANAEQLARSRRKSAAG